MNEEYLQKLINTLKNKDIVIATHWDADGITSGAMFFHLLNEYANIKEKISKGIIFRIDDEDINYEYDFVVITDIIPGKIKNEKVIYVDHHPHDANYFLKIHDPTKQSCSLLIWESLIYPGILKGIIPKELIRYYVFLTLLGYFGDGGREDDIPIELYIIAKEVIPDLMRWNNFNGRYMLEIEKFVPLLNIGKRAFWDGTLPLQMLITTTSIEDIVYNLHPIAQQLNQIRAEMRQKYSYPVNLRRLKNFDIGIIECESNIQGVLCNRLMDGKPILIINKFQNYAIGSMRVPDNVEFDAGSFLKEISKRITVLEGGGHKKAAGITIELKDLDVMLKTIEEFDEKINLFTNHF